MNVYQGSCSCRVVSLTLYSGDWVPCMWIAQDSRRHRLEVWGQVSIRVPHPIGWGVQ